MATWLLMIQYIIVHFDCAHSAFATGDFRSFGVRCWFGGNCSFRNGLHGVEPDVHLELDHLLFCFETYHTG